MTIIHIAHVQWQLWICCRWMYVFFAFCSPLLPSVCHFYPCLLYTHMLRRCSRGRPGAVHPIFSQEPFDPVRHRNAMSHSTGYIPGSELHCRAQVSQIHTVIPSVYVFVKFPLLLFTTLSNASVHTYTILTKRMMIMIIKLFITTVFEHKFNIFINIIQCIVYKNTVWIKHNNE